MKKVAVWGTFDNLHEAHIQFLKRARSLGDELLVVIIPDKCVLENKKRLPKISAELRRQQILQLGYITNVVIDSLDKGLSSLLKYNPDIFVFGYDQKRKWDKQLKSYLSSKGLNPKYVRLDSSDKRIHSSKINI